MTRDSVGGAHATTIANALYSNSKKVQVTYSRIGSAPHRSRPQRSSMRWALVTAATGQKERPTT